MNVAIDSKKQEIAKATSPIGSVDSMEETIKQEIKKDLHKDYCIEMYKGRADLINECFNR